LAGLNPTAASKDLIGKTGTSNDTADVWLMVSSPRITIGTWAGHDDNTGMDFLTGYNNNAAYVSYLISTLYNTNPSLFDGQFALADSVIASSVLASTGQAPGTAQYNGRSYNVSGGLTTSYWAKNGAPVTTYNFMVGGTNSDRARAWNTLFPPKTKTKASSTKPSSSTTQPESED
jgi:penicillin-binding protein